MFSELFFRNKKFAPLFWTQFFGALNDNFFKNALVVLVTFNGTRLWGLDIPIVVALAGGIFILPFFLFSPLAGQLSDKKEKSLIIRLTKWWELLIMVVAAIGFYFATYELLMLVLFLMGAQSTFFGPTKYSIIPDLVAEKQLTAGNAYIEVGTFVAILIGTIIGGLAASLENSSIVISVGLIAVALVGLFFSRRIPAVAAADPNLNLNYNIFSQIFYFLMLPRPNKIVWFSILSISWFWFLGAAILSILPVLTKEVLHSSEQVVTFFLAIFTIGIAIGALVCEKLSFQKVEMGLVPWGSLGMFIFLADLGMAISGWSTDQNGKNIPGVLNLAEFIKTAGSTRIVFDLLMFSVAGGLYTVPLYALVQERTARNLRSRMVASNNILNALFMVIASLFLMGLYAIKLSFAQILVVFAGLNIVVSVFIYRAIPDFHKRMFKIGQ